MVHAVYSTPKERSRPCRPHFRRQGKLKDGVGNPHAQDCPYNVPSQIRVLRDSSAGALVRERCRSGPPRYRLVVPEAFGPATSPDNDGGVQVVAERLTTVLNTAAKIAALIEHYAARGVDPNIEWCAECRGERVEWLSFLYTPQRTWALRRRLLENGSGLTHPVAVLFSPYVVEAPWRDRIRFWRRSGIGYRAAAYRLPPETDRRITAELVVAGEYQLLESVFAMGSGKYYIGYGMWEFDVYARGSVPRLMLHMDHAGQVSPLSADISPAALSRWRFLGRLQP
ncbi:hypothetical protein [Nocardia carnea]|uniref:hypothetical protein n=1 Tax=Nocardia carnea TaxID=37328 RepID=UPI002458AD64|nr:hypothetical protein [Nocardia carnea]